MAWTQADVDTLKAQIALGVKQFTTRHGDTMVAKEFHSLADMRSLLAEMEAELIGGATLREPYRRTVASYSKGL